MGFAIPIIPTLANYLSNEEILFGSSAYPKIPFPYSSFIFLVLGTPNVTSNAQATSLELNCDSIRRTIGTFFSSWTASSTWGHSHALVISCWTSSFGPLDVEADAQARTQLIQCQRQRLDGFCDFNNPHARGELSI